MSNLSNRTYLHTCLFQDEFIVRWPDGAMPINVYIAPFQWYEQHKQREANVYRQLVLSAFAAWSQATQGKVTFNYVSDYNSSQIDVKWRRINRKSLGHTQYEHDPHGRMFSACIEIGISDGVIHAQYDDHNEVSHTIIHEIGHALGLIDHSDDNRDIMFVPHQYGVFSLSPRDIETVNWLYSLPIGFSYRAAAQKYQVNKPGFTINDVIEAIERKITGKSDDEPQHPVVKKPPPTEQTAAFGQPLIKKTQSLDEHHEILSQMGRFHLHTQNIRLSTTDTIRLKKGPDALDIKSPKRPRKPKNET